MKLGIMGAMPEEVADIVSEIQNPQSRRIGRRDYISGVWHGIDVVVVFSHWGKVAATSTATMLLSEFGVTGIIFVGVAGAVDPSLNVGDVVIGSELLQYDMDVSAIPGVKRFEIPLLGRDRFSSHQPWAELSRRTSERFVAEEFETKVGREVASVFSITTPRVVSGLIASGDRFVNDPGLIGDLRTVLPDLRCVEMEGAAVAQVCFEFDRPFVVLRVISDKADHAALVDFQAFVKSIASVMTAKIASGLVAALAHQGEAAQSSGTFSN